MSATVDLLPPQIAEARRHRIVLQVMAAGFVVLLVALAGVQLLQLRRVDEAVAIQEQEEARLAQLRTEVSALGEFGLVTAELESAELQLATALGREVGLAGVLQDVAAVLPSDANVDQMTVSLVQATEEQPTAVAQLELGGETRRGVAPGVERLMVALDKVDAFTNAELRSTTVDGEYARYELNLTVDVAALTGRYADGLPEELR